METNKKKTSKLIFNMGMSRSLLREGCTVIDVKADRNNPEKTILVFKVDENFERAFEKINNEIKKENEEEAQ